MAFQLSFIYYNCEVCFSLVGDEKCIMDNQLTGSDLTRAMLERDYQKIWCAVGDESDQQAVSDLNGNDFTAYIVKFQNGYFYCDGGMQWSYAVPIKIVPIKYTEAIYIEKTC